MATIPSADSYETVANSVLESSTFVPGNVEGQDVGTFAGNGNLPLAFQYVRAQSGDVNLDDYQDQGIAVAAAAPGNTPVNLTGSSNTPSTLVGNAGDNVLTLPAGGAATTGGGNDVVTLGGQGTVVVGGSGNATVVGSSESDSFSFQSNPDGEPLNATFGNLNPGDTLRVFADVNGDGQVTWDDVDLDASINASGDGNTTFVLKDGSSFTLEGVGMDLAEAAQGNSPIITFTLGEDEDGNLFVDLS